MAIEGLDPQINIDLSQNTASSETIGEIKILNPKSLQATPEQMHRLAAKVRVLGKGDPIGSRTCDAITGRIPQQQTAKASYERVSLAILEELEIGKTYQIQVIEDKFHFSADVIWDYTRD